MTLAFARPAHKSAPNIKAIFFTSEFLRDRMILSLATIARTSPISTHRSTGTKSRYWRRNLTSRQLEASNARNVAVLRHASWFLSRYTQISVFLKLEKQIQNAFREALGVRFGVESEI